MTTRRGFLRSVAAGGTIAALGGRAPALAQSAASRVLKFVPQANLTILDPIWTTAAVTAAHGYYVYDTLFGVDEHLSPKPQMAEGFERSSDNKTYTIKLREGLKFHDNEPVRAADCVASIKRWGARDPFGQSVIRLSDEIRAVDDRTIELKFKQPFLLLIDALAKPQANVCFVMPERIANTDPNTQISEHIGSGPYRFVRNEYVSGNKAVYSKFDGYAPRQEQPSWTSGGKVAHFERIEWLIIPDASTASAALQSGEIDWWEMPLNDLIPVLQRNRNIAIEVLDTTGYIGMMRFNHLHPPFDKVGVRRAILGAVNQEDYLRAIMGDDQTAWRTCFSVWPCGSPFANETGADALKGAHDIEAAKRALREGGYNGEKVVILNPTDFPTIAPMGQVTNALLRQLGMNVELVETDWGTVVQRRASREPVERGGWSIFHTWWGGASIFNPAVNATMRGNGAGAWFGWPTDPQSEELHAAWLVAPTPEEQMRIATEIQRHAFETAPMVPLGQFFIRTGYRRSLTGVLKGPSPYPWNVRRA
jgi:peptide/nickel transport system substrate-binding protein